MHIEVFFLQQTFLCRSPCVYALLSLCPSCPSWVVLLVCLPFCLCLYAFVHFTFVCSLASFPRSVSMCPGAWTLELMARWTVRLCVCLYDFVCIYALYMLVCVYKYVPILVPVAAFVFLWLSLCRRGFHVWTCLRVHLCVHVRRCTWPCLCVVVHMGVCVCMCWDVLAANISVGYGLNPCIVEELLVGRPFLMNRSTIIIIHVVFPPCPPFVPSTWTRQHFGAFYVCMFVFMYVCMYLCRCMYIYLSVCINVCFVFIHVGCM